eukprot:7719699-Pyramimonas_sp.AAC.1
MVALTVRIVASRARLARGPLPRCEWSGVRAVPPKTLIRTAAGKRESGNHLGRRGRVSAPGPPDPGRAGGVPAC